jgi:hypothetical protein
MVQPSRADDAVRVAAAASDEADDAGGRDGGDAGFHAHDHSCERKIVYPQAR